LRRGIEQSDVDGAGEAVHRSCFICVALGSWFNVIHSEPPRSMIMAVLNPRLLVWVVPWLPGFDQLLMQLVVANSLGVSEVFIWDEKVHESCDAAVAHLESSNRLDVGFNILTVGVDLHGCYKTVKSIVEIVF
jgi:hypothetical protein